MFPCLCPRQREELLTLCCYVGALVALRRGYLSIVAPLLCLALAIIRRGQAVSEMPLSDALVQAELEAWKAVAGSQTSG